jgi:thioredoxin-dependent peroxiredoxin
MFLGAHLMATRLMTKKASGKTTTSATSKRAPSKKVVSKPKAGSAHGGRGAASKTAAPKAGAARLAPKAAPRVDEELRLPDFRLTDQQGQVVSRKDLLGAPFVLYFYPKDDTPGCTTEACDFRDQGASFKRLGCRVVGVSPDSERSHKRFADKYNLPFTLLSDPDKVLAQALGVWQLKKNYGKEYMGIVRSTFLVDAKGKVAKAWRSVKVKAHAEAVLAALGELA